MNDVKGEFFRKGKLASRFKAGRAAAKFGSNALEIDGGVEVSAASPRGALKARRIVWNPDKDRIEASGKVTVETDRYTLGPFNTLYASPNLDEVGTPDMFRKLK